MMGIFVQVNGHSPKGRSNPIGYVIEESGCWRWVGNHGLTGYGHVRVGRHTVMAHRYVFERDRGAVPDGLQLDHLCRNRGCVNPDHLEPVTARTNVLRGDTTPGRNANKTHCHRGHPLDGANLGRRARQRYCRECNRRRNRLARQQRRGSGQP